MQTNHWSEIRANDVFLGAQKLVNSTFYLAGLLLREAAILLFKMAVC